MIAGLACQDIKASHMQQVVNAASTPGEGDRVRRMISALVTAGIEGGSLTSTRLAKVHWQAAGRALPALAAAAAGESVLWVDPPRSPPMPTSPRSPPRWPPGRAATAAS